MFLTRAIACVIVLSAMAGCATSGYSHKLELGVDNHVNFDKPALSVKFVIESR